MTFPAPVPEIPAANVDKAAAYYVDTLAARGCSQRPVGCEDLERSVAEQLTATWGTAASAMRIQQPVDRIRWTASTREVLIELHDGTRLDYFLPWPNRPGVRRYQSGAEGHIPRVSRLLALAIKLEQMVREGAASSYAGLAAAGQVSGARMSQIVALTNLAPAIQEQLLFLPCTVLGVDRIVEKDLRTIAGVVDWQQQMALYQDQLHAERNSCAIRGPADPDVQHRSVLP